mmetsp:Transcript_42085/g.76354  ORF Transcript_42085/g.76354 Transcript_42085/m.76354 type:complete len:251 (-) Transcript_42085:168-920(-)
MAEGMLKDGSNPEGVDPVPPLGWKDKSSFKDVKMVNMESSPPCSKIRYHLTYGGIPYTCLSSSEYKKQFPDVEYHKVPALINDGRIVNDSYIIVKNLTPAIYGTTFNEEWEQKITYGIQLAMEVEAFEDKANWPILVTYGGFPSWFANWFGCVLPLPKFAASIRGKRAKLDEKYGALKPTRDYLVEFKDALGSKQFFAGSDPGQIDVSMFGTIGRWVELPLLSGLMEETKLKEWWSRMEEKMPKEVVGNM